MYLSHWINCFMNMYQYIKRGITPTLSQPRNIEFKCSDEENENRRQGPCKITLANRAIHFLHTMSKGGKVWQHAMNNG